ncbi:hypothetical protein [Embleya sp. MST-111070]|uniref:hypothetical protein n=1 Tax=Embleya sp. MST-111070 TaxID=3398231 RepID=UPI003F734E1B
METEGEDDSEELMQAGSLGASHVRAVVSEPLSEDKAAGLRCLIERIGGRPTTDTSECERGT